VLLIVTDGEPTAQPRPDEHSHVASPPDAPERGLARFIDALARRAGGHVVAPELDDLGRAVVDSYLGARHTARGTPEDFGDMLQGRSWWW